MTKGLISVNTYRSYWSSITLIFSELGQSPRCCIRLNMVQFYFRFFFVRHSTNWPARSIATVLLLPAALAISLIILTLQIKNEKVRNLSNIDGNFLFSQAFK